MWRSASARSVIRQTRVGLCGVRTFAPTLKIEQLTTVGGSVARMGCSRRLDCANLTSRRGEEILTRRP